MPLTDNPSLADHLNGTLNGHAGVTAQHSLSLTATLGTEQAARAFGFKEYRCSFEGSWPAAWTRDHGKPELRCPEHQIMAFADD